MWWNEYWIEATVMIDLGLSTLLKKISSHERWFGVHSKSFRDFEATQFTALCFLY